MHKDPLAREREFRQQIERAARTQRAARIRRARPWLGWMESLCGLLVKRLWLTWTLVVLVIVAGFFAWSFGYLQQGSVTDTSFRTNLARPKGEGTLRVQWYNSPVGSSLHMELDKDGAKHRVYGGPIPCR